MDSNVLPPIEFVEQTDSTNDDAMARGRAGAPHGYSICARRQTNGRGRRGHVWSSPEGGLYLSVVVRPEVPMSHLLGLSAVCGLGILEALRSLGAQKVALKWPNDVIVFNPSAEGSVKARKLCGLLMEAGTGDAGIFAVAGVGINLDNPQLKGGLGSVDPLPTAALADAFENSSDTCIALPSPEELACAVRAHIVARCDAWAAEVNAGRAVAGPLAPVLSDYVDALPLLGQQVRVVRPDGHSMATGVFSSLDVWGRAGVHLADGSDLTVSSEQASLRPLG